MLTTIGAATWMLVIAIAFAVTTYSVICRRKASAQLSTIQTAAAEFIGELDAMSPANGDIDLNDRDYVRLFFARRRLLRLTGKAS